MKDQFVTYEIALKLKELGFNEPCLAYYYKEDNELRECCNSIVKGYFSPEDDINNEFIAVPLWQQAVSFLKENEVLITELWDGWKYNVYKWGDFIYCKDKEETFLKAIELCQNKE